jgi:hypothetical protein
MFGFDQRLSSTSTSNSREKHSHGCSGGWCTYKVWYAYFHNFGSQEGTMQIDMAYATIVVFGVERRLYR